MKKKSQLGFSIIFVLLAAILMISVYTVVLQRSYGCIAEEAAVARDTKCADVIHQVVSDKFNRNDFQTITTKADMETARYQELQQELNELRRLNSTRYLYTAKRGDDGRLIYLIDGLDLDAEDFAYPGTYIEEEMIPYIDAAMNGQTIYSSEIVDTTWGHIFTACYPVVSSDGSGDIIGALCMEMDMEDTYAYLEKSSQSSFKTACVAVAVSILLAGWSYMILRRQRQRDMEYQEKLQKAAVAANAANRAKSTFLFNMSHDIRTPLNGIMGLLKIDKDHFEDRELVRANHDKMLVAADHLLSLINDVLEVSKLEDGNIELAHQPMSLADVSQEVGTIIGERTAEAGIRFEFQAQELPVVWVYGSPLHLRQIFLNIYGNCIKYNREGGSVTTQVQCLGAAHGRVTYRWTISDTGVGMSQEFLKRIFEPFAQERADARSVYQGTGLGMTIVRGLVEKMNGTIEVTSREGEGSTFVITLPFEIAPEQQPERPDESAAEEAKSIRGLCLLLVEDNDLNAEIAQTMLEDEGAQVTVAENGKRAVERFQSSLPGTFDAILMDVMMPVMDGLTATRAIRALDRPDAATVPILAMTANAFKENAEKCFAAGMNAHLTKPLRPEEMVRAIARCCDKEKAQ